MRVTRAVDSDDVETIIIGFTQAEFDSMKADDPAWVEGRLLGLNTNVVVFAGEDEGRLMKNIEARFDMQAMTAAACPQCAAEWGVPYEPMPGAGIPPCAHMGSPN